MLTTFGADLHLLPVEMFALLISGLCHDLEHPGKNNAYMIHTHSELATMYNDQSVLENHHAAATFRLLRKPENFFLERTASSIYREFRKHVVENILSTDTSQHTVYMSRFQQRVENVSTFSGQDADDRALLCRLLMKSSDISNVAKPWQLAKRWSNAVSDEFFAQGDEESRLNLTPAPFMDRTKSTAAKNTANFIDFLACPLFKVLVTLLPLSSATLTLVGQNRLQLEELIKHGADIPRDYEREATEPTTTTTTTKTTPTVTTTTSKVH
jgi:hypothetical protein